MLFKGYSITQTKIRKRNTVWSKIKLRQKSFLQERYLVTTLVLSQAPLVKKDTHVLPAWHCYWRTAKRTLVWGVSMLVICSASSLAQKSKCLRNTRECEREIDWWSHSLRQKQQLEVCQEAGSSPLLSP